MRCNMLKVMPEINGVHVHLPVDGSSYVPDKTNKLISKVWDAINSAL